MRNLATLTMDLQERPEPIGPDPGSEGSGAGLLFVAVALLALGAAAVLGLVRRLLASHDRALAELREANGALRALEQEAQSSEDRYQDLFDSAPAGILQLDAAGRFVLVNQTLLDWLGWERRELVGKRCKEILTSASRPVFRGAWKRCVEGGRHDETELELCRKDGETLPASFAANAVRDAEGSFAGYRAMVRDLSRERQLEEQLRQAQRLEAVGLLAGGVAHDFNNLLMVIGGNVEMAQMLMEEGQSPAEEMQTISEAVGSASSVVRQLLTFSHQEIFSPEWVDVRQTFASLVKMLGRLLREDIELVVRAGPEVVNVQVDSAALEQALLNLAINASDAMPAGGKLTLESANAHVERRGRPSRWRDFTPGDYVRISVADTGVGMDEEALEKIFDPFYTTKSHGTGLGLPVVFGIVQQHQGFLDVTSEPDRGTRFDIYLPALEKLAEESSEMVVLDERLASLGRLPTDVEASPGAATLLVAEDEERLRRLAKSYLETLGFTVLAAADGEEALKLFLAHRRSIELVILDSVMPRLSGPTAYEQMARMRPGLPCIFVTGYSEEMSQDLDTTHVIVLKKPISYRELGGHVREILGRAEPPPPEATPG